MTADADKKRDKRVSDLKAQLARLGYGPGGDKPAKIMTADELRKRFTRGRKAGGQSAMRGAPARSAGSAKPATATDLRPVVYRRDLPREPKAPQRGRRPSSAHVVLEEEVSGVEVSRPGQGAFYLLRRRVNEIEGAADVSGRFRDLLSCPGSPLYRHLSQVLAGEEAGAEDLLFMDLETTGLSCSPLFLVGVMLWHGGGFEVRQFLARNYAEEGAVVRAFFEECAQRQVLISFNGKSFDWPFIRARAAANGLPVLAAPGHLDLLHVSRRIWRHQLPDCRLQTLERSVCRRCREGDIPGSEIPEAYHEYVRTGNAWQMVDILRHNMLDLVTLADLMTRFPDEC